MQQPHALDYRQQYGGGAPQPGHPAPAGQYPGYPANPYHRNTGLFQNPLTTGQWLMIGAAAVAVGGLAYYGYTVWQDKKKQNGQQANQQNNPVRHVQMGRDQYDHGQQPYPRAA